jgi:hypothetical protein
MIQCPTCGKPDCIQIADEVLDSVYQTYMACPQCTPEPNWDKRTPLAALPGAEDISSNTFLCPVCGHRPLDVVMGHVLSIMLEHGDRNAEAGLATVGTPLITKGFSIMYPPRLGNDDLVLIADDVQPATATDIVNSVPEIKGVVLRVGDQMESVGIRDSDSNPHEYTLLSGCDMRCDLAQTSFGELVIYKSQSKIHIEFPRDSNYKMGVLEQLDVKGMLAGNVIVDGMCGPGTLGLMAMMAGADRVIFNDAWRPAIENVLLNLRANKGLLNVEVEPVLSIKALSLVGDEPLLVARATRGVKIAAEVYFGDLRRLPEKINNWDVCMIDTFPNIDPSGFVNIWTKKDNQSTVIVI